MALLTLQNIGKIYVSEGAVAVGIRGVNLSFEKGEFVAITGQSGSGKSTLLNVISGMDTYEEGELLIEGNSTSHYLQGEWEEYREKYISFIFQDYNIIESFTVLQNVELALMHIEDKKERRRRALELLSRVGLSSHIRQKGSQLSGGQKQRTVIARALAKDSPIILADEPTGNLDSATSREIIQLLREVSHDKLLIVVTHNFEEVEEFATRHIRVFDGAVESDHILEHPETDTDGASQKTVHTPKKRMSETKKGMTLGLAIFTSKPRLSAFLSILMIVGMLGIFLVTSFCGEAAALFEDSKMFTHIDGRVVLTKQNGAPFSMEDAEKLAEEYRAKSFLRFDSLLDESNQGNVYFLDDNNNYKYANFRFSYREDLGADIMGRYPEAVDEVLLYMPISLQPIFGETEIEKKTITFFENMTYKVVGVKYYYDNNIRPVALLSHEGFRTATAIGYLMNNANYYLQFLSENKNAMCDLSPSFDLPDGKLYIASEYFRTELDNAVKEGKDVSLYFFAQYYRYDYYEDYGSEHKQFSKTLSLDCLAATPPEPSSDSQNDFIGREAYINAVMLRDLIEEVIVNSYRQMSLFFENDKEAYQAAEALMAAGYIAVPSDATYQPGFAEVILNFLAAFMMAVTWVMAIFFLTFFLALCSRRTLEAFKGDMAIMRSMGISVKVIRIGMYVRMMLALIPAIILLFTVAVLIFTSPVLNDFFVYLYFWQYALIILGMVLLTVLITRKHIKRLFGESVKKALKGGGNA